MINYSELRAGNLVETPRGIYPVGIISYSSVHVQTTRVHPTYLPFPNSQGFDMYPIQHLNPVHISVEWVERCGFSNNSTKKNEWYLPLLTVTDSEYDVINLYWHDGVFEIGTFIEQAKIKHIKFVHQIQNLVFALTGTELIIKKPEETTG
jgi:hypothetical protein